MRSFTALTRVLGTTALISLVAACGGSGGPTAKVSVPSVEFGPASNTDGVLRPLPNGFSFVNFGAASVPGEEFGGADLAAMFGSGPEICANGADDTCVPTAEAAEWAHMVNESRQAGHCEGFIVQALQRFAAKESPDTSTLSNSAGVVHGIMRGFASQFMPGTRAESKGWSKQSVRDITAELVSTLKDGIPDYVLGVYGDMGGHAVLPYSVTFADADHATIGIYDSNWPGQERHVSIDLAAQEWAFSFDGTDPETDPNAWTGGNGDMDLSSLKTHVHGPCPFCDSETTTTTPTMLAIRASAPTWTLATARGTVTAKGADVDGVHVSKVRAASAIPAKRNEWVVMVEPTEFSSGKAVRLSLPAGSSATIVTPSAIARATTGKKALAEFSINERSITTASKTATLTLANGNKQVSAANKAVTLSLDSNDVPVDRAVATTTTPSAAVTATTKPSSSATTTAPTANSTAGSTVTTAAPVTTVAPATTVAQTTTTTSPVNFTHSFRNGVSYLGNSGASGYSISCSAEILDVTVTGAATINSVTGTVDGTAMQNASGYGNSWSFYSMPSKPAGTYSMTVTVNASNGTRTKTLSILYDSDCNPNN